jgi:U3 small nucleolar RNA-associated protein 20
LGVLAAIWKALLAQQQQQQQGEDTPQQQQQVDSLLQHWEVVCLLLGHLSHRESRTAAAAALASLGALIDNSSSSGGGGGSFAAVAAQVVSLNSWSSATLDEPDYTMRLGCYSHLQPPAWQAFSRLQALPLLLQGYYDLRDESDLALRQAAATALTNAVRAFAALDSQQQQQGQDPQQQQQQQQQRDDPLRLLPRVVYPQLKGGLRSSNLSVRQEHAALLRQLVLLMPGRFPDLLPLCSQDPEQDFFLNITHLQIHRRGRALGLLVRLLTQQQQQQQQQQHQGQQAAELPAAAAAADGAARKKQKVQVTLQQQQQEQDTADQQEKTVAAADTDAVGAKRPRKPQHQQQEQQQRVSARVLLDIAAPLIQQFIFEGSAQSPSAAAAAEAAEARGGHGKKAGDSDREGAVANVAIDALQAIAGQLGWEQYSGLLMRWLKLMGQYPRKQIIRAACAVLDAFHFPVEEPQQQQQQQQQGSMLAAAAAAAAAPAAAPAAAAAADTADGLEEEEEEQEGMDLLQEEDETAAAAAAADAADVAAAACVLLQSKVLPLLQAQVVVDDQEVARAPVALAIIKLIKVWPLLERIWTYGGGDYMCERRAYMCSMHAKNRCRVCGEGGGQLYYCSFVGWGGARLLDQEVARAPVALSIIKPIKVCADWHRGPAEQPAPAQTRHCISPPLPQKPMLYSPSGIIHMTSCLPCLLPPPCPPTYWLSAVATP